MVTVLPCHSLLFDLDGTLVDTAPDLCGALNHVLRLHGRAPLPLESVRHLVGGGARTLLARGFGRETEPRPGEEEAFDQTVAEFLDYYEAHLADHSRPFPGVREALARLAEAGFALGIVTNKPEQLTRPLLHQLGLDAFFPCVVGGNTLTVHKPDPAPLFHALACLGRPSRGAVMVGDSETDADAAHNAAIPVILVTYGYTRGRSVEEMSPALTVSHFGDLPECVRFHSPAEN
ncbi:MAG: phosphoglycolate phosphatase [Magnetococcales bacterium]|nr:phosphoglycolate phosphatase [Magnetococcales bacterium]